MDTTMTDKDDFEQETISLSAIMKAVELELLMGRFSIIFAAMSSGTVKQQARFRLFMIDHREEFAKIIALFEQGVNAAIAGDEEPEH